MNSIRQWTILTVVTILAILLAGYFLLISPKSDEAAELRAATAVQEASNNRLSNDIKRLEKQALDLPRQQAKLAAFAQRIPTTPALPTLIRSLTDAADRAGVDLISMAPTFPAPLAAPPPPTGQTAAGPAATADALYVINVTLSVVGGYVQCQQFFSNLEDLQRSFQVTTFTMAPGTATEVTSAISGRVFMAQGPGTSLVPSPVTAAPPVATTVGGAPSPGATPVPTATPAR